MNKARNPINAGDVFVLSSGGTCTVIAYERNSRITIRHDDSYGHTAVVEGGNIRKGNVRNPYARNVYGMGMIGVGPHKVKEGGKKTAAYALWTGIMQRGYCPAFKADNPSYQDVSVCSEWHSFQVFAEWFSSQEMAGTKGFQLDKDLIIPRNREYSPAACSFVPSQINSLLNDCAARRGEFLQGVCFEKDRGTYRAKIHIRGKVVDLGRFSSEYVAYEVYRRVKEKYVREMAEEYRFLLHPSVYENLKNWTLE